MNKALAILLAALGVALICLLVVLGVMPTDKEGGDGTRANLRAEWGGAQQAGAPRYRLKKEMKNEMEAVMDTLLREGIDEKMRESDLYNMPKSKSARPASDQHPFTFVARGDLDHNSRRLLAGSNVLKEPAVITFDGQPSSTAEYYAYQHIFTNLKEYSSQFVVYPFDFNFMLNATGETKTASRGAVFKRDPADLPSDETAYNYFKSVAAGGNVDFGKAKALYDINIAVLKIEEYHEDIYKDLTYESSLYCNLLSSYLGKYKDCMSSTDYIAFKGDAKNVGKTALVMVNGEDIASDFLRTADGGMRFRLLIIPDYYTGADGIIKGKLGTQGMANIRKYLQAGGFIFASGKGGYLLETWDILPKEMYKTNSFLTSTKESLVESLTGCEAAGSDFVHKLLCMNVSKTDNLAYSYLLSAFMINPAKTSGMKRIMSYNQASTTLKKKNSIGLTADLTADELQDSPFALLAEVEKGRVYLMNGNPLFKSGYNTMIYNMLFLAMSKNVVMDVTVGTKDNKPIPGGEAGIILDVTLTFMNLYDTNVDNLEMHIFFPNQLVPTAIPASCAASSEDLSSLMNLSAVNTSSHLLCGNGSLGAFGQYEVVINVEILEHTVTQQKFDVLITSPYIRYTDTASQVTFQYDMGGIRTDAALAALLRGTFNADPAGFWPLRGQGDYVDNVLQVENKEDTNAIDVEYIGVVPLITPVVDGVNQKEPVKLLRFLPRYYNTEGRNYYYPFTKETGENYDYVDYKWLVGKNVVLTAEWDIPVKQGKVLRDEAFPNITGEGDLDIENINYNTNINSKNIVLKQIYYIDADKFFEHAAARLMVMVDTSKEGGAKALYPDGIPEYERNPNKPTVCKKELGWTRVDIYFYTAAEYQYPQNIDAGHVVSLDRYPQDGTPCVSVFGDARATKVVPGFFSNSQPTGLKEDEFSNEILMYCSRNQVRPENVESVSNGSIKPMHYLIPIVDSDVQRADDVMHFEANADGTGSYKDYPELKFIYAHTFHFSLDGSISRQGARLDIELPEGVTFVNESTMDPVARYWISYTADQVAFYNTTYNKAERRISSYLKRGLMPNEAYGKPSQLEVNLENLNVVTDFNAVMKIYEMKYDISKPELNYERFMFKEQRTVSVKRDRFYSLPAVEIRIKLNRRNSTEIFPYELLEPFTRYGVYYQELQKHRTFWVSVETHQVSNPGLVTINPAYAMNSHIGISSVPFAEYLTTGMLLIPSSMSTSRIEWTDIWDRRWVQAMRSVFPDCPPLPGPLRNFVMTTTFELTKAGTTERVLEWNSDEPLEIRVQLKLLNNYAKYFAITTCKDNEYQFFNHKVVPGRVMMFDPPPYSFDVSTAEAPDDSYHLSIGNRAVYGMCFDEEGTILGGGNVSAANRERIATAYLCAETLDPEQIMECASQLADLPTVQKRPSGDTHEWWMFSPEVERYYPLNYIMANMWDMTHRDYDDSPMVKAHRYHMDNNLPSLDPGPFSNPALTKPHNIIAQPIWKGFGYEIAYSNQHTLARFPQNKGWWSDNLQNKDHTLLAGQSKVNTVSVDKQTLLPDSMWINARDLKNPAYPTLAVDRLKNIHICLYNQHRVKVTVNSAMYYHPNVVQNNVIPIIPDLEKDDLRLTNYDCNGVYQYSPKNISLVDNVLKTPTIRDWLYFSANLRGNALETINIPYTLNPISNIKIEGMAKVADGGRFVYWNPALGPNAYLVVDNPVNVVEAKRNDLTISCEVFPKTTTTFNPVLYHLLTVEDVAEKNREWKFSTYTNNYGFGDATVAVFVGGAQATKSIINVGEYTLVKITYYNNAGFDWNMYGKAIDFEYVGSQPINAYDLIKRAKHAIQKPLSYNFMNLSIPAEIKDYVNITPSDHNIDVAPQFFDFMNINVVTIRDGFKGDYYYKIVVADTIPDSIRGKVWEVGIMLNEDCFDQLPGYNDPTVNYHDYKLKIPSIKFGIPYASGANAGKVFYTSGYSTNLRIVSKIPNYWAVQEMRLISEAQIGSLRMASADPDQYNQLMLNVWNTLDTSASFPVTNTSSGSNDLVTIDLHTAYPQFPIKNGNDPDIASINLLVKCSAKQLDYGTVKVISSPTIYFSDFKGKSKSDVIAQPVDKTIDSKGAWLKITYSHTVVEQQKDGTYKEKNDQRFFEKDTDGIVKLVISTTNVGTATAYYVNMTLMLSEGVMLIKEELPSNVEYSVTKVGADTELRLDTGRSFAAGDRQAEEVYLKFSRLARRRLLASSQFTVIKSVSAAIDLTSAHGDVQVSQTIVTPLKFSVIKDDRESVALSVGGELVNGFPLFHVTAIADPATTSTGKPVRYKFYRTILALDCESDPQSTATGDCGSISKAKVALGATSLSNTAVDSPIPSTFTGVIRSGKYQYLAETYDEKMQLIAAAYWEGVTVRGSTQPISVPPEDQSNPPTPDRNPDENGDKKDNQNDDNGKNETVLKEHSQAKGYAIPLWAIILIPTAALAVIIIAGILIYRKYKMVKIHDETQEVVEDISKSVNVGEVKTIS